jgi:hypothetical protein
MFDGIALHCRKLITFDLVLAVRRCNPHTQFDCTGNGEQCIDMKSVCNGKNDCGSFQDEDRTLCNTSRGDRKKFFFFKAPCLITMGNHSSAIRGHSYEN